MLDARGVTVIRNGTKIVDSCSVCVAPGSTTAIVGPNGAGKSTMLEVLSGDIRPDSGAVRLNGRSLRSFRTRSLARHRAVLPQKTELSAAFTVREVALIGRTPHVEGWSDRAEHAVVDAALEATHMREREHRLYPTLSGGEQQRTQLARTLSQLWPYDPGLASPIGYLLLDEPTAGLDLRYQHDVLSTARQFSRQGVGVLAIVHDLNLAAQYADTVYVMKRGGVFASGSPKEVFTEELLRTVFDTAALVQPHPCHDCPLIILTGGIP
jgi:iron complex transport system ATP-binding protein